MAVVLLPGLAMVALVVGPFPTERSVAVAA
jgi:hypothetical protein